MKSWMRVLVVLALSVGGSALACSCSPGALLFPVSGSTGVPLNTVVRMMAVGPYGLLEGSTWHTASGQQVLFTEQREMRFASLTPLVPLLPNTEYIVTSPSYPGTTRFTTGTATDVVAPSAPTISGVQWNPGPMTSTLTLDVSGVVDDVSPPEGILLLIESTPHETALDGGVNARLLLTDPTLRQGWCCVSNTSVPLEGSLTHLVQAMDWAGNVSSASVYVPPQAPPVEPVEEPPAKQPEEPAEVPAGRDPTPAPNGCSSTPVLLLGGVLGLINRRRRT